MTKLTEGHIEMTVPVGVTARKFDDNSSHGLSHCMKAVDFVLECPDRYLFIEIKDPQHPAATASARQQFIADFCAGRLDNDLKYKYRDSFLYELASGRDDKQIYYYVIVAIPSLSTVDLLRRTDALKRALPVQGPRSGRWSRQIVTDCAVFNMAAWNQYQKGLPLSRV